MKQSLTNKEKQVLDLALKGTDSRSIGVRLGVSTKTVKFHLTHIYAFFGVKSRNQLICKHFGSQYTGSGLSAGRITVGQTFTAEQIKEAMLTAGIDKDRALAAMSRLSGQ